MGLWQNLAGTLLTTLTIGRNKLSFSSAEVTQPSTFKGHNSTGYLGLCVPTELAADTTYTVPAGTQFLFSDEIDFGVNAELNMDGVVIEVR